MRNEELTVLIKAGERDRLLELWEQVRGLVACLAMRQHTLTGGLGGVEVDDLVQSGYIAMVNAVEDFDPGAGYKFTTYLTNHLKTAFAAAGGYRSEKQSMDPLHSCDSLDRHIDGEGGDTIGDLQAAPGDFTEDVEHRIWCEQLRKVLNGAMADLPEAQRVTLEHRYYQGKTLREIGQCMGLSINQTRRNEQAGIQELRRNRRRNGLDKFHVERVVDQQTPWHLHVGLSAFNSTGTSAVERLVFQRERDREQLYSSIK